MNTPMILKTAGVIGTAIVTLAGATAMADEVTERRDVGSFNRIVLEGAADLSVSVGKSQSSFEEGQRVLVSGEANYISRTTTEVRGETLYISQDFERWHDWNDADIFVQINVESLEGIEIDGAGDIDVNGVKGDFEIVVAGAGDITVDDYEGGNFDVVIRGAGDLSVSGSCDTAFYRVDGAGDIEADTLQCDDVTVMINGAGDADIYANGTVKATINGVGDISIRGNPENIERNVNGFGDIVERS